MNILQSIGFLGRGSVLMVLATAPVLAVSAASGQEVKISQAAAWPCSPVKGKWSYLGKPGPYIFPVDGEPDRIKVDMTALRQPYASGRILSPTQIEVSFPGATLIGTLDGMGRISWSNGTIWQAENLAGIWRYEGIQAPKIKQSREYLNTGRETRYTGSDNLDIDMSKYGRPRARGAINTNSSSLSVTFADRSSTPQTGTAVSPTCIKWSDGTTWTR
jgi:hypothetical protein